MGLHICQVVNRTNDRRGEFVEVANDGPNAVILTGLEITDYTETQARPHIYRSPNAQGGLGLDLPSGCAAYVFSGTGANERLSDGDLLLFAGRHAPVWNDSGDVAYLRQAGGTFIDSMTVGAPKRHPNGH